MQNGKNHPFGSTLEAIIYPAILLVTIWLMYGAEQLFDINWVRFGVYPRTAQGLIGILFMPLIHAPNDISHLLNNSLPILILTAALVYFYRDIALKVFVYSWVLTGLGVWIIAADRGSFHIGISGVIYALATFIFVSGWRRKYLPLQALALFVAFLYGGMIWGVFKTSERISWEGHLSGMVIGYILALIYVNEGPVAPKYQYEIEKEMGIEPPDLEGMYLAKMKALQNQNQEKERIQSLSISAPVKVIYFYLPQQNKPIIPPKDEIDSSKRP
ncbi:MAG: rhomboid family intramembrane serine protease [Crocinitomicaceae bacterium]